MKGRQNMKSMTGFGRAKLEKNFKSASQTFVI